MSVIWCGGEDIDFPNGIVPLVSTASTSFRSGFARCGITGGTGADTSLAKSDVFAAVTSAWLRFYIAPFFTGRFFNQREACGFGLSGTNSGLFLGYMKTNTVAVGLYKSDGTTVTLLASLADFTFGAITRFDIQVINYGANATVNIYADGALAATYTGDVTVPGMAHFDSVFVGMSGELPTNGIAYISEIIVADESTLGWQGLVTAAPNGNGTTQQWSNPDYTNISPVTINDANSSYTDVVGQDQQVTLLPEPAGNYLVKAVKVVARANGPAGSVPTGIKLGFNNGTTVAVGAAHTINTGFAPYSDIFATDPTTGQPWGSLVGYQMDLRSA